MNDSALLRLENIGKDFGPVTVLNGIDLEIASNEFLTILGPSGSGKTTILRMIGGFDQPTRGRITLNGKDLHGLPINRRPFNTVFQDYALFPHYSVRRNVAYGLVVRGLPRAVIDKRVEDTLKIVGLESYATRLPHELSGGQRQRVALARAIICEPRVILLDEPLAALDVTLRAQMCRFLKDMQRRLDVAFVFITHDQQEAIAMSDRIVVMRDGCIEQIGTPETIYASPNSRFVAGFFGENNLIDGTVVSIDVDHCLVDTAIGRLNCRFSALGLAAGRPVHVALRPEIIGISPDEGHSFTIKDVQFSGPSIMVEAADAATGAVPLRFRIQGGKTAQLPKAGDLVNLTWSVEDAFALPAGSAHG
ncbi:spermidine/putrescine transport system ATP-binding protein [Devosia sp. UYZn731]|uniref:ABC transporter ATP-binding protein n=1 Tax=Devosia sp. UYZn731 TaxID=3156345 RepID=UPI003397037F